MKYILNRELPYLKEGTILIIRFSEQYSDFTLIVNDGKAEIFIKDNKSLDKLKSLGWIVEL